MFFSNETVDMARAHAAKHFGLDQLVSVTRNRYINPERYFSFLRNVPSQAKHPFFSFKVFNSHLKKWNKTTKEVLKLVGDKDSKVVILWRRRFIEQYVSHKIARRKDMDMG